MLAAEQRLRRRGEFVATMASGRRAGRGALVVYVDLPTGAVARPGTARVGLVVGKAVGGAVGRNWVRRRLRHLARARLGDLPQGANVVIRALPGAANRSYRQLGADLDAALAAVRRRGAWPPHHEPPDRERGDYR